MSDVHVFVPEIPQRLIESAHGLNRIFAKCHVPPTQPLGRLVCAGVSGWADVKPAPIDLVPVRCQAEQPVYGFSGGRVVPGVADVSSDAPNFRVIEEPDDRLNPMRWKANVVIQERDILATGHRETNVARPGGPQPVREFHDLEVQAVTELAPKLVWRDSAVRLKNKYDLERPVCILGGEIREAQRQWLGPPVGGDNDGKLIVIQRQLRRFRFVRRSRSERPLNAASFVLESNSQRKLSSLAGCQWYPARHPRIEQRRKGS